MKKKKAATTSGCALSVYLWWSCNLLHVITANHYLIQCVAVQCVASSLFALPDNQLIIMCALCGHRIIVIPRRLTPTQCSASETRVFLPKQAQHWFFVSFHFNLCLGCLRSRKMWMMIIELWHALLKTTAWKWLLNNFYTFSIGVVVCGVCALVCVSARVHVSMPTRCQMWDNNTIQQCCHFPIA